MVELTRSRVGSIVVLAIAFLLTLVAEGRDKGSWRKALWLFRLTPRRAGTYIITNTKLFCSLCT